MKVLWTTSVKTEDGDVLIEKDSSNTIMDFAAAIYLHRLEQPVDGTSIYDKLKYVAFGTDSSNPTSTTEEILTAEFARENITSSFRYENNATIIAIDYSYENLTGAEIEVTERGVISGGDDFASISDWGNRTQTGYLFSRQIKDPITLPNHGVLYGTIRIYLNI